MPSSSRCAPCKTTPPASSPFTPSDFDSNDGFLTYVWGPGFWMTLHTISLNYPTHPTAVQRRQYKRFFDSLQHVLPCGKCRDNLTQNLKTTRYGTRVFENRDTLSRWVYDLHSTINTMLGKTNPMTYSQMRHMYENFRARCGVRAPTSARRRRRSSTRRARGGGAAAEDGCTVRVKGIPSKCILRIVPARSRSATMKVDRRCLCRRG